MLIGQLASIVTENDFRIAVGEARTVATVTRPEDKEAGRG
jgi:hypothetical protein